MTMDWKCGTKSFFRPLLSTINLRYTRFPRADHNPPRGRPHPAHQRMTCNSASHFLFLDRLLSCRKISLPLSVNTFQRKHTFAGEREARGG